MPDWLAANAGTVLTVGGSIIVALIAAFGAWWAKTHTPRQPVPIQDVWSENRSLRADLLAEEARYDVLDEKHRKVLGALVILWRYVQRIRVAWGIQTTMPALTASERRHLAPHIEDIDTPGTGTPAATN